MRQIEVSRTKAGQEPRSNIQDFAYGPDQRVNERAMSRGDVIMFVFFLLPPFLSRLTPLFSTFLLESAASVTRSADVVLNAATVLSVTVKASRLTSSTPVR